MDAYLPSPFSVENDDKREDKFSSSESQRPEEDHHTP